MDLYERDGEKTKGIAVLERLKKLKEKKKELKLCEREFFIDPEAGDLSGECFEFSMETNEEGTPVWVKRGHAYFYLTD